MNDCRLLARHRAFVSRAKLFGSFDTLAMATKGARVGGEIRILQFGCRNATWIVFFLMHTDGAVHTVIDDQHNNRSVVLHSRRKLLPMHHEAAVARKADHRSFGPQTLGADSSG